MGMLRVTLRQLQIFVAVARAGSTTAASIDIALSQSATSAAINELERLLSQKLFDRAGKRLLLNAQGRALLAHASHLIDSAMTLEHSGLDADARHQALRIGASTTLGNHVLPRLLQAFWGRRPAEADTWQSHVVIGNTTAICDAVAAFDLDIGLIEGPCHHADLLATPWLRDELVVVAAATRSTRARRWSVRDLRDQVWLLRETGSGTREVTDQLLLPHLRHYRRSIELGSSEAIVQAAAHGLGIACLSAWVAADAIKAKRLQAIATTLPRLERQCHWVCHRQRVATPTLNEFLRYVETAQASV